MVRTWGCELVSDKSIKRNLEFKNLIWILEITESGKVLFSREEAFLHRFSIFSFEVDFLCNMCYDCIERTCGFVSARDKRGKSGVILLGN